MKIKSMRALLMGVALLISIFIPVVVATLDSEEFNSYQYLASQNNEFKYSKIQSKLLEAIETNKEEEREIIVVLRQNGKNELVQDLLSRDRQQKIHSGKITYHKMANAFSARVKADTIKDIAKLDDVEKIYEDFRVSVALFDSVPLIKANSLWSKYDGTGVTVAVLDTGVDPNHPDLKGKVIDKISFSKDESPDDGNGHGTHVAGIIAGSGTSSGGKYKGVAPGALLMNIKVLNDEGYGPASSIMQGIEYAVDNGADIISLSLGTGIWPPDGTDPLSMTANAAVEAGVVVIVAAGNNGVPLQINAPATAEKVIAVGASTKDGRIAGYSSQGPTWDHRIKPEVVAPGGASPILSNPAGLGIVSTKATGSLIDQMNPRYSVDKYYLALSGTSMATPHVSGVAALLLQANPQLTPEQIKQRLMNTAVDLGYDPINQGAGRVNALSAVKNTIHIIPASLSYIMNPGTNTEENIKITNDGKKKRTLSLINTGDLNIKFSTETISIEPGETKNIKTMIEMPPGLSAGVHAGIIMVYDGNTLIAKIPVLEDTPITFTGGKSKINDKIELGSIRRGTNYYYFDVPEGVPGISSTLKFTEYTDIYLIDPVGAFVDKVYGYTGTKPSTVSVMNPKAGRWMILIDSRTYDPYIKEVPITLMTYLNVMKLQPMLWSPATTISAGNSIIQNYTITNTGKDARSVQVDAYMNVANSSASGTFKGKVSYIREIASMNSHAFYIPDGSTQYTFTLTALDNKGSITASIYDPAGIPAGNVEAALIPGSLKINDPMPGKWKALVRMRYTPINTTERYRGEYAVVSKNTVWITNKPETVLIRGLSSKEFISTLTLPADANGYYTGKLTISGNKEQLTVPISINAGQNIALSGDFDGKIRNKEWRYYKSNVNSDHLNVSIGWNNSFNDLDLFVFDPSGNSVASSTRANSTNEDIIIPNPVAGEWIVGVYGYNITGNSHFTGTLS